MVQLLGFSDENSTLVAMVKSLATNFVIPQFHVVFDEKFFIIQNNTSLEDTAVEAIFNELFTNCRDFYGEEGHPPKETISAPEGDVVDSPPKLGGEWLTEAERRDKDTRTEYWRVHQHTIQKNQAKQSEKINDVLQPIWPLDCDDVPYSALTNDDDSSVESDDGSIVYAAGPFCKHPGGATDIVVPPPWR